MIKIKSVDDFKKIKPNDECFLECDIDFKNVIVPVILENFSGVFDGCGHKLTNITLSREVFDDSQKIALFESLSNATLKNLKVENLTYKLDMRSYAPDIALICTEAEYSNFENISIKTKEKYSMVYSSNNSSYKNVVFKGKLIENSYEDKIEG